MVETSHPGFKDYVMLVGLAAIWGSSFVLIKSAVETAPVLTVTAGRMIVATLILLVAARMAGQTLPYGWRIWGTIFLAGITGNALPFTLINWGEKGVDSSLTAILMGVMPLATVVLAHVFTRDEKANSYKWIGVLFGLIGLIVLIGPTSLGNLGKDFAAQMAILVAALCYSINALIIKSLMHLPRRSLAAAVMVAATLVVVPMSLAFEQPWTLAISTESALSIVVLGILQTAIATLLTFAIIRSHGATFFSQINFMVPVFGVFWGAWLLAERPGLNAYAAMVLILIGLGAVRLGTNKNLARR